MQARKVVVVSLVTVHLLWGLTVYAGPLSSRLRALKGRAHAAGPRSPARHYVRHAAGTAEQPLSLPAPEGAAQPAATAASSNVVVTAMPLVALETAGPAEINVGKLAHYTITVRNMGEVEAEGVIVEAVVPDTAELNSAEPEPASSDGKLRFELGRLPAKDSKQIELDIVPTQRGTVDLRASLQFAATTQSVLQVRKPELAVQIQGPQEVLYGDTVSFKLVITNTGDGPAENVQVIQAAAPSSAEGVQQAEAVAFQMPEAIELLPPGQSQQVQLQAVADKTGLLSAEIVARADGDVEARAIAQLQVRRPMIQLHAAGPKLRYAGRIATYRIRVANPGDAPAKNVKVVAVVPAGLEVTAIEKRASYDREQATVSWTLAELPPESSELLKFQAKAVAEGEQMQQVTATADRGLTAEATHVTRVQGIADIEMTVTDTVSPIEVGAAAEYEIRIKNRGTKLAEAIKVQADLPEGLEAVAGADYVVQDNGVVFETVGDIEPGTEKVLRFQAIGRKAGDYVVKIQLHSQSLRYPVLAQESTLFYNGNDEDGADVP